MIYLPTLIIQELANRSSKHQLIPRNDSRNYDVRHQPGAHPVELAHLPQPVSKIL